MRKWDLCALLHRISVLMVYGWWFTNHFLYMLFQFRHEHITAQWLRPKNYFSNQMAIPQCNIITFGWCSLDECDFFLARRPSNLLLNVGNFVPLWHTLQTNDEGSFVPLCHTLQTNDQRKGSFVPLCQTLQTNDEGKGCGSIPLTLLTTQTYFCAPGVSNSLFIQTGNGVYVTIPHI